jgi:hypothetical protein
MAAFAIVAVIGLFAFTRVENGSIKGRVTPASAATDIWAVSGMDSLRSNIESGSFQILNAKPGVYRLIIVATSPYKPTTKEGVMVNDGQTTDVGEIKLEQ